MAPMTAYNIPAIKPTNAIRIACSFAKASTPIVFDFAIIYLPCSVSSILCDSAIHKFLILYGRGRLCTSWYSRNTSLSSLCTPCTQQLLALWFKGHKAPQKPVEAPADAVPRMAAQAHCCHEHHTRSERFSRRRDCPCGADPALITPLASRNQAGERTVVNQHPSRERLGTAGVSLAQQEAGCIFDASPRSIAVPPGSWGDLRHMFIHNIVRVSLLFAEFKVARLSLFVVQKSKPYGAS